MNLSISIAEVDEIIRCCEETADECQRWSRCWVMRLLRWSREWRYEAWCWRDLAAEYREVRERMSG